MKAHRFTFILMSSLLMSLSLFAGLSCAEKREELRERLKKCPTQACKEKVKKLIKDLDCNGKEEKKEDDKDENNNQGNNSGNPSESDCKTLVNLWTNLEPLKKEGNPDSTKHIESNLAYREYRKGLRDLVDNSYEPIKGGALHDKGTAHSTNAQSKKDKPDIGAFEFGKAFPQVGANLPKFGLASTNKTQQAKKASPGFQPHKAKWLDHIRSEQDDL
jgi:hypothetical protein